MWVPRSWRKFLGCNKPKTRRTKKIDKSFHNRTIRTSEIICAVHRPFSFVVAVVVAAATAAAVVDISSKLEPILLLVLPERRGSRKVLLILLLFVPLLHKIAHEYPFCISDSKYRAKTSSLYTSWCTSSANRLLS